MSDGLQDELELVWEVAEVWTVGWAADWNLWLVGLLRLSLILCHVLLAPDWEEPPIKFVNINI